MAIQEPKGYKYLTEKNYLTIPSWIVAECGLTGSHRDIYALIFGWHQGKDEEVSITQKFMAEFIGTSTSNIAHSIKDLVDTGWLTRRTICAEGAQRKTFYRVVLPESQKSKESPKTVGDEGVMKILQDPPGVMKIQHDGHENTARPVMKIQHDGHENTARPVMKIQHIDITDNSAEDSAVNNPDRTTTTTTNVIHKGKQDKPSSSSSDELDEEYLSFINGVAKVIENKDFSTRAAYEKARKEYSAEQLSDFMDQFVVEAQKPYELQYQKNTRKFFEGGFLKKYANNSNPKSGKEYDPLNPTDGKRYSKREKEMVEAKRKYEEYGKTGELVCPVCNAHTVPLEPVSNSTIFTCPDCNTASDFHSWKKSKVYAVERDKQWAKGF